MALVKVKCIRCESSDVNLHGKSFTGIQRYRCTCCKRVFQLTYKGSVWRTENFVR